MIYVVLKALHVVAVATFVAGLLANAIVLRMLASHHSTLPPGDLTHGMRSWDRVVTTPALAVLWAAGIALAVEGRWFAHPWLGFKLVAVVALSGMHGVQSGRLRRLGATSDLTPGRGTMNVPWFVLGAVAFAVVLVILKPGG